MIMVAGGREKKKEKGNKGFNAIVSRCLCFSSSMI